MKKTYISPEFLTVELRCNQMLAESMMFGSSEQTAGVNSGGFVKEDNTVTDKSIWDEEW